MNLQPVNLQQIVKLSTNLDWEIFKPIRKELPSDPVTSKYGLCNHYWILRVSKSEFDELANRSGTSYDIIKRLMDESDRCDIILYNESTNKDRTFELDTQESATNSHLWVSKDSKGKKPSIYLYINT